MRYNYMESFDFYCKISPYHALLLLKQNNLYHDKNLFIIACKYDTITAIKMLHTYEPHAYSDTMYLETKLINPIVAREILELNMKLPFACVACRPHMAFLIIKLNNKLATKENFIHACTNKSTKIALYIINLHPNYIRDADLMNIILKYCPNILKQIKNNTLLTHYCITNSDIALNLLNYVDQNTTGFIMACKYSPYVAYTMLHTNKNLYHYTYAFIQACQYQPVVAHEMLQNNKNLINNQTAFITACKFQSNLAKYMMSLNPNLLNCEAFIILCIYNYDLACEIVKLNNKYYDILSFIVTLKHDKDSAIFMLNYKPYKFCNITLFKLALTHNTSVAKKMLYYNYLTKQDLSDEFEKACELYPKIALYLLKQHKKYAHNPEGFKLACAYNPDVAIKMLYMNKRLAQCKYAYYIAQTFNPNVAQSMSSLNYKLISP